MSCSVEDLSVINLTDAELLKIFPEAKDVLDEKIDDWTRIKGKVFCKKVLPALEIISAIKDDFTRWFAGEVYKTCLLPKRYSLALENLERLKRLKLIATVPKYASKIENRERSKLIAKQSPILSLYSFQKLRKVGDRWHALCPFHAEDTSSFVIYPNNSFYCFGCQAHGDSIEFIKLLKNCSFNEALGSLAGVAA